MKSMIRWILYVSMAAVCAPVLAQEQPPVTALQTGGGAQEPGAVMIVRQANEALQQQLPNVSYRFIASEMSFDGNVVKGVPMTADATTETTQVLADGNRIVHNDTATLYRDSQGRTRREQTLQAIGPWTASGDPVQIITINDPVAGVNYALDSKSHVAHKLPSPPAPGAAAKMGLATAASAMPLPPMPPPGGQGAVFFSRFGTGAAGPAVQYPDNPPVTEQLGQQTINGVLATGTRTTQTIPAGTIGNEQPIEVVSEQWYSNQLQTVVMTKHSDPRMGTTVYQLSNIQREEPSPALFQVPPDYTVQDAPAPLFIQQKIQIRK